VAYSKLLEGMETVDNGALATPLSSRAGWPGNWYHYSAVPAVWSIIQRPGEA